MTNNTRKPRAKRVRHTDGVQTVWLVEWPSTAHNAGRSYYVTTYPNSDLIFIETSSKRRPVSERIGSRIGPAIRAAIQEARG